MGDVRIDAAVLIVLCLLIVLMVWDMLRARGGWW